MNAHRPSAARRLGLVAALVASLAAGSAAAEDAEAPAAECAAAKSTAVLLFVDNPDLTCFTMLRARAPGRRFQGCYVTYANVTVLPRDCDESKGKIGSSCRVLVEHEDCHAKGFDHMPDGRGWVRRAQ